MNSLMANHGTVPWSGTGTSRHSRIPAPAAGRSKSAGNEKLQDLRHSDRSNDRTSRYTASGNRPVNGELEIRKKTSKVSRLKLIISRPFSVESSPSSLSSSAVDDPAPPPPPVNERLNAAMEKLFELYRRQERRGSLGGSDTDASLSGGGVGSGGGGGADAMAEDELAKTSGRVRSRRKRRIPVRRSKSSLVDKSFSHDSVQSSSVGYSQTIPKDEGPRLDRLNSTKQRHGKHEESAVRDRRVVTYEEDHQRVARKFVPPKATGVVLGPRSRSCGLTRHGSQRETSSSRYPEAGTRAYPRTRSHESTERGQKPGTHRNQRDGKGTGRGTSEQRASHEPRRSRYESHRLRKIVTEDIPKADYVDQDNVEVMFKSDRYGGRRNPANDLRRSASTRGSYRSDEALNREAFRRTQRVDDIRKDARHTGSMSRIPLSRTFTTTKKLLEQSGSGSDSDMDLARSSLALRKGHPNESTGDPLDPGTILISNQSLW